MVIGEQSESYGKDAYYFSHDSNARNDHKCLKLRRVLGMEGYGIFWVLVEMLRDAADYKLPLSVVPDIAYESRVSEEKILAVINNFELFEVDNGEFFSLRLIRSMEKMQLKSNKNRQNALKRWNNATALQTHSERNALKESKGKETKENESIYTLGPDSEKFILIYPQMLNASKYRLNGYEGVFDFYQINRSICPKEGVVSKFIRDNNGKHFNDFMHLYNSISKYMEKKYVG